MERFFIFNRKKIRVSIALTSFFDFSSFCALIGVMALTIEALLASARAERAVFERLAQSDWNRWVQGQTDLREACRIAVDDVHSASERGPNVLWESFHRNAESKDSEETRHREREHRGLDPEHRSLHRAALEWVEAPYPAAHRLMPSRRIGSIEEWLTLFSQHLPGLLVYYDCLLVYYQRLLLLQSRDCSVCRDLFGLYVSRRPARPPSWEFAVLRRILSLL
jgi:hypothetical protein